MKYWREFLIFVLWSVVVWFFARGFESLSIERMAGENAQLKQIKANTEQLVNQSGTPELQKIMKNLGYNVTVKTQAKPDTSKKGK